MQTIKTIILCLVIFICANVVSADPGNVASKLRTFTWTANTEADLAGYKIYHNNNFLVDVPDPTAISLEYLVTDLVNGDNVFNITAYDTLGNESEFSKDVVFQYDVIAPNIPSGFNIVITISITQTGTDTN